MPGETLFENRVEVGGKVFWDAPGEVVEGEVLAIADGTVTARVVRRWRAETAEPGPDIVVRFPETFFEQSVAEPRAARAEEPWWHRMAGSFADDPVFDEMVRLGREYNEATFEALASRWPQAAFTSKCLASPSLSPEPDFTDIVLGLCPHGQSCPQFVPSFRCVVRPG